MARITFNVELRDQEARTRLSDLVARMDRPLGFYTAVGEHMVNSTKDNFRAEADPEGVPWQKLAPRTIRARQRKKLVPIHILRAGGYLAGSINYRALQKEVRWGATPPYAAAHQFGGEFEMPPRPAKIYRRRGRDGKLGNLFVKKRRANEITDVTIPGRKIRIPARPFLGIKKTDEGIILELAAEWLSGE